MTPGETELWGPQPGPQPAAGRPGAVWWAPLHASAGSLKFRITLAVIGCLAVGIGSISLLSLAQVERDLLRQTQARELDGTASIAADLSVRVIELQNIVRLTAQGIDPALEALDDALEQHLQAQPALLHHFANVFVAAPDGTLRLIVDEAGVRRPRMSIADRGYFRQVMAERRPIVSDPVPGRISGEPVIVLSHPIVRDGRVTSVIGGALRLSSKSLAASLLERKASPQADDTIAISDATGRVIGHPNRDLLLRPLADDRNFAEAVGDWQQRGGPAEPAGLLLRQAGQIVTVAGVAGPGWNVWRARPESSLLAPLRAARLQAVSDAAVVIAVLGALSLLLVRRLLRPLAQLEQRARRMFEAHEGAHDGWPVQGGEIGSLVRALRHVIAERAQLEQFSADLHGKLRSVMAAAPLGIAFTRSQRFELVSQGWAQLLRRDESELVGASAGTAFASESDYESLGPFVADAFAAQGRYEGEWAFRRKDGSQFWGQLCGRPVEPGNPAAGTVWTLADVTATRANRETLEWSASHDPLTGLANRKGLARRLEGVLGDRPASLLVIDLDRFKPVNDTHGHAAGDAMLRTVAQAITTQVRASDLAVRLGGDEFAVLLDNCPPEAAERVAAGILEAICAATLAWDGHTLRVGASVGVAHRTAQGADSAAWLATADAACYAAKAAGRRNVQVAGDGPRSPLRLVSA